MVQKRVFLGRFSNFMHKEEVVSPVYAAGQLQGAQRSITYPCVRPPNIEIIKLMHCSCIGIARLLGKTEIGQCFLAIG